MKKIYIIAEAGVNHNGAVQSALRLCDAARKAGADAVKFQTFRTERCITRWAEMAAYQQKNTRSAETQFKMVKRLELRDADFRRIKRHCDDIGIEFLSTPDDEESLKFLLNLGLKVIKIGSGEVTNVPYLRKVGSTRKDIVLSTGMSTMKEVGSAYHALMRAGARSVTLLHCTTDYPCRAADVNLLAMVEMRKAFRVEVGYSDHTLGVEAPIAAAALGAVIIEKHLTLNKDMEGPDHAASLEPEAFGGMVRAIRLVEQLLGDGRKRPMISEKKNMTVARRSIVAACPIKKGKSFTEQNLAVKRPGSGISPARWDEVLGRKAKKDFKEDEMIRL